MDKLYHLSHKLWTLYTENFFNKVYLKHEKTCSSFQPGMLSNMIALNSYFLLKIRYN